MSLKILLVEDHLDTARALSRLLMRLGYDVSTAETCAGALQLASSQEFDLVISDLGLPDRSGLELMRQLLQHRPIKGIALTGYGMQEDVEQTRAAGFASHLTKPVSFQDLQSTIEKLSTP